MFAGISEDRPWPPTGLTSAKWLGKPVVSFKIADLVVTQPGVLFDALMREPTPVGGDEYPHVVMWNGTQYLEDGHHRVMRALLRGETEILARVETVGAGR